MFIEFFFTNQFLQAVNLILILLIWENLNKIYVDAITNKCLLNEKFAIDKPNT